MVVELTKPNPGSFLLNIPPNIQIRTKKNKKGNKNNTKKVWVNTNKHGVMLARAVVRTILTLTPIHEEKKKGWEDNRRK